ncbi:MAG: ester cyclase [Deltaproteobacteria bacterium]|nr:ester cyclase [Deltaproteobacteria bacterium]
MTPKEGIVQRGKFELSERHVRDLFFALFDRQDFVTARTYWKDSSVDHFLALGRSASGPDDLEAFFRSMHAAMPDLSMDIESVVVSANRAVVQWRLRGTFDGAPFEGIEATGRRVDLRGCDCFVWDEEGLVDENTVYYDGAAFARQIGLLPQQDSAGDRAILGGFNLLTRVRKRLLR